MEKVTRLRVASARQEAEARGQGAVGTPGGGLLPRSPVASLTSRRWGWFEVGDIASDRSDTFCGPIRGEMAMSYTG
jgi:hypothetical protein